MPNFSNMASQRSNPALRGFCLFTNFFLIILAYYLIKPASRSLFLEHYTSAQLPYVWIASAVLLGCLMPFYSRLVGRVDRRTLVFGSCILFAGLLLIFGTTLTVKSTAAEAVMFYVLVDILSVVLVEQFWSLTNSAFATDTGSRWYGLVGSGGLTGGLVGGQMATWLVKGVGISTTDLLFVSAAIIGGIALFTYWLSRIGMYAEQRIAVRPSGLEKPATLRRLLGSKYMLLITATILFAQLIEPIVEYQFMSYVEVAYSDRESRTAYLGTFLSMLGGIALVINLLITPLILRTVGAAAGIALQPIAIAISSGLFQVNSGLASAASMKVSDRALSYSINRAAKEMLYVPVDPALIYRAKAWIDMFGYRLFKVFGSMTILALTQWTPLQWAPTTFTWLVVPVCIIWFLTTIGLHGEYRALRAAEKKQLRLEYK